MSWPRAHVFMYGTIRFLEFSLFFFCLPRSACRIYRTDDTHFPSLVSMFHAAWVGVILGMLLYGFSAHLNLTLRLFDCFLFQMADGR